MKTSIQSENLSSIMIYSGESYLDAANALANREYGHYIEDLGYLRKGDNASSYWTKYSDLVFEETEYKFDKIKDIYDEGYAYQVTHYPMYSGNAYISTISGNGKTVSRYHAEYSYQTDLNNEFSNIVEYTAYDLNNFLKSVNYQKYNKENLYGDEYELTSIRIGSKTFDWHVASDIAYTDVISFSTHISYFFGYSIEDGEATYFYSEEDYINSGKFLAYSYSYEFDDVIYTYNHHNYEIDDYYWRVTNDIPNVEITKTVENKSYFFAYYTNNDDETTYYYNESTAPSQVSYSYSYDYTIDHYAYVTNREDQEESLAKRFETINPALQDQVSYNISLFENKYNNDEELYTYYMYDCTVDIPMTLTTRSFGVKKSTFEMRYNSEYDRWYEYVIPINIEISSPKSFNVTAYEDGVFGVRINENKKINDNDVVINKLETGEITINSNIEKTSYTSILSPYNMKSLDLSGISSNIYGVLDLTYSGWTTAKGNHISSLIIGNDTNNTNITKILGINDLTNLNYLDISNISNMVSTPAISRLSYLSTFKAKGSNIQAFKPALNTKFDLVELPNTIKNIRLQNIEIEDENFDYEINTNLNSVVLDTVTGIDTYKFVTNWNNILKENNSLIPDSLIYLELNNINWNNVPVTIMEDIKKFDLNIKTAEISVLGTSNYGMLSREEYIKMTKLYGVNAFYDMSTTEKVYKGLTLKKVVNTLPEYEYKFTLSSEINDKETNIKFDNTDNPNTIIAVNGVIDKILANATIEFKYDRHEQYIYHKFSTSVDTKDTIKTNNSLNYGDIILYNGDTIIIVMDSIQNPKIQYIKLGNISDNNTNIKTWFNNIDSVNITFTQYPKPITINRIITKINDVETTKISLSETLYRQGIEITVEVDEPTAENKDIVFSVGNLDINVKQDNDDPSKYLIKLKDDVQIPMFSSKEYKITFGLDGKVPSSNIQLKDIIYNELVIEVISQTDQHAYLLGDIIVVDPDNVEYDEETQIITFNENTASFDEETEILTIE